MRRWLKLYFQLSGISVDASRYLFQSGIRQSAANAVRDAMLEYSRQMSIANQQLDPKERVVRPSDKLLQYAVNAEIDEQWRVHLIQKNNELSFDPQSDLQQLATFVKACTGKTDNLDIHTVAHVLWQIKRKMHSYEVTNHLMVVFVGKQGVGKSTAVTNLFRPIESYRSDMAINALTDERNFQTLEENFVIVCDEMHGCDKTDVESLKQIITGTTVTSRRLFTNIREKLIQRTTFVGTSNNSLDLLIRDGTGMRRFYEIKCADKVDWNILGQIDYTQLWKSINENSERGYLDSVKAELQVAQEEMRNKDQIETYIEESGAIRNNKTLKIRSSALYADYKEWAKSSGFNPVDKTYFGKRLKHLGFEPWRTNADRGHWISTDFSYFGSSLPSGSSPVSDFMPKLKVASPAVDSSRNDVVIDKPSTPSAIRVSAHEV